MVKEGVHLTFKRDGRQLWSAIFSIQHANFRNWNFPDKLPAPLKNSMSRNWIHKTLGEPERSFPPEVIMKRALGWTDIFSLNTRHIHLSMQIHYDVDDMVASVVFLPTSELRW